jgi:hypothetical protein
MRQKYLFRPALLLVLLSLLFAVSVDAQKSSKKTASKAASGVLWQKVNIGSQDLFLGQAGGSGMPDLSRITFIREDKGGYSTKYRIRDGSNRVWVAKIGKEAQSETAAVRLLSALGYHTEIVYLVPRITIPTKGTFTNVRLEARPDAVDRGKEWRWKDNPFVGTNQLQGLKIMMAMINNWDLKDSNNVILKSDGNRFYVISDLGATFGKMGISSFPLLRWIGRTRNEPKDYSKSGFVRKVENGRVKLSYKGKNPGLLRNISVGQARWLADLLTQLSMRQIRDAFRAANYTPQEIDILARAFQDRVLQLDRAASYRMASTR